MRNDVRGQNAVITGAGSGVGKACALALAKEGVNVSICARSADKLEQTARECERLGVKTFRFAADITDEEAISRFLSESDKALGGIDIVVNNAGRALLKPAVECCASDYDDVFALNVRAPILMCIKAVEYLRRSKSPTIVNIASSVALKPYINQSIYGASKYALRGFTQTFAQEVSDIGIKVLLLCPGGINTEMIAVTRPDLAPESLISTEDLTDILVFALTHRNTASIDEFVIRRSSGAPFK